MTFVLQNRNLPQKDHLYHIGLQHGDNFVERFGDVKFVCMGGKSRRMKEFAEYLYQYLNQPMNSETEEINGRMELKDISDCAGRYSLFKVGPVLSVSHGIGSASLTVVLHEVFKLLHHAKCEKDVEFIRMGTSGGIGLEPGTLVLTNHSYNAELQSSYTQVHCGKVVKMPSVTDNNIRNALLNIANEEHIPVTIGNTMSTDDFFEAQARTDGAFCCYSDEDKFAFLQKAHDEYGIRNIEMESQCLSALCKRAGVKCAIACVTLVNRLKSDDVTADGGVIQMWQTNLYKVIGKYIADKES